MLENNVQFKKHNRIKKMALVAVFAALNFVVMLFPKIPIPSLVGHPYIHLGNLVVILVAIFFGGLIGGLSGAIGMGIYDITSGYGIWTIKTIILKLGIGLVTGLVYKLVKNRDDKSLEKEMIYCGSFFLAIAIFTSLLAYFQGGSFIIHTELKDVTIDIPWPLYVFSFVLGLLLVLSAIFAKGKGIQKAMYAASMGVLFNIVGELVGGFIKKLLQGEGFKVSMAMSIASIPATIINGCVVLFVVFFVFPGIDKALSKIYVREDEKKNELQE